MKNNLLEEALVKRIFAESGLPRVGKATIREIKKLSDTLEKASGVHFIHMEMGNPGLPAAKVGIDAQIEALKKGVPATYPDIDGVPVMRGHASGQIGRHAVHEQRTVLQSGSRDDIVGCPENRGQRHAPVRHDTSASSSPAQATLTISCPGSDEMKNPKTSP